MRDSEVFEEGNMGRTLKIRGVWLVWGGYVIWAKFDI